MQQKDVHGQAECVTTMQTGLTQDIQVHHTQLQGEETYTAHAKKAPEEKHYPFLRKTARGDRH